MTNWSACMRCFFLLHLRYWQGRSDSKASKPNFLDRHAKKGDREWEGSCLVKRWQFDNRRTQQAEKKNVHVREHRDQEMILPECNALLLAYWMLTWGRSMMLPGNFPLLAAWGLCLSSAIHQSSTYRLFIHIFKQQPAWAAVL